jgi:hypothetical protein
MGCDGPTKRPHRIQMGGQEEELLYTCPRKLMRDAVPYLKAHRFSSSGNLTHMYPIGELPARVAEAIDLLDTEQARRIRFEREEK